MEKSLDQLAPGEDATVVKVLGAGVVRRRLLDLGLTPHAVVTVCRRAPLGDPLEVTVRGYQLTLRQADARQIIVVGSA